jgi:protein O-GlcNAc transferase
MATDAHAAMLQAALALQQQGNLKEARRKYESIIARDPRNFNALQLCGVVALQQEAYRDAVKLIRRALALRGNDAPVLTNLGVAHQKLGQVAEALECFDKAIAAKPDFASAHHNRANLLREAKRRDEAMVSYDQALALQPENYLIHANRASVLYDLDRFDDALAALDRAIALRPDYATAHFRQGQVLLDQKKPEAALESFERALRLQPDDAEFLDGRGKALLDLERFEEALLSQKRALELAPNRAELHNSCGLSFYRLKRVDAALAFFKEAIALKPDLVDPHIHCATIYRELSWHEDAMRHADRAIALAPDNTDAQLSKAYTLNSVGKYQEALPIFETLRAKAPEDVGLHVYLAQTLGHLGRNAESGVMWEAAIASIAASDAEAVAAVSEGLHRANLLPAIFSHESELTAARQDLLLGLKKSQALLMDFGKPSDTAKAAFETLAFNTNGFYIAYQQENDREAMRLLSDVLTRMLGVEERPLREGHREPGKIRLGIASEKLYHHNGSSWAYPWLSHLPADYEFFTYAFHGIRDETSAKFAELGTHRRLSFDATQYAKTIAKMRADNLDILMLPDIGMTPSSRILSLHRIAPIQFTAWGHPVTSGSSAMDFYLSSDLMEPEDGADHYTEKLIRLPNIALYVSPRNLPPPVQDFPLPEGRVLYGCLQSLFKYLPRYDHILPRIAAAVPKALFVFIEGMAPFMTKIMRARLEAAFADARLAAEKHVMFLPRMTGEAFDALTQKMDVLVDSPGWSGGNTTLTAIEAGMPMVTLPGAFMRGRHSYAMFRMMDMPSAIAAHTEDFVAKLVALGRDAEARNAMRQDLQARKSALYDDRSLISALDDFLKAEFTNL